MPKHTCYEVKDGRLERRRQFCPKCGPGTFMALHKDRTSCGRCGYTEYSAANA